MDLHLHNYRVTSPHNSEEMTEPASSRFYSGRDLLHLVKDPKLILYLYNWSPSRILRHRNQTGFHNWMARTDKTVMEQWNMSG